MLLVGFWACFRERTVLLLVVIHVSVQAKFISHHNVNDVLKKINRHLGQTFIRDFPFYLVFAYKMQA